MRVTRDLSLGDQTAVRCAACRRAKEAGYRNVTGWYTGADGFRHNHLQSVVAHISTPNIDAMTDFEFQAHFGVTRSQIRREARMKEIDRAVRLAAERESYSYRPVTDAQREAAASMVKQFPGTTIQDQLQSLRGEK